MAQIFTSIVRVDIENKTAKRCTALSEMLQNNISLLLRIRFVFICLVLLFLFRAGLDVKKGPTKNIFPTNQKGYDTFETTVGKLSARRIQICFDYFCLGIILKVILNNFQNNA